MGTIKIVRSSIFENILKFLICISCRLLGKAKLFLESLVESKENKIHVDVNLTDGYGNPTEVSCTVLSKIYK